MTSGLLLVVPCLNEADHLPTLIGRLLEDAGVEDVLVVADGGSQDGSQKIVDDWSRRDARVRLLANPKRLQSAGVNLAAEHYGADRTFLIRIDAHAAYPVGFVPALVAAASATHADSIVVPMRTVGRSCFQIAAATAQNAPIGAGGSAHRVGGASGWIDHGHHALMRLDAFRRIDGYDPDFSHNEDAEYDRRLTASGGRIWFQADLAIDYFPRRTPHALFRQYINHGKGRARTVVKHQTPLKLRQLAPALVAPAVLVGLGALVLAAVFHPILLILAAPAALWVGVCLLGGALAARAAQAPPCGYLAGVAAMVMHLGWSWGFLKGRFLTSR
ncbi:MAG: glycosyltransferase family 2 protein [Brevundimonas sp.]